MQNIIKELDGALAGVREPAIYTSIILDLAELRDLLISLREISDAHIRSLKAQGDARLKPAAVQDDALADP